MATLLQTKNHEDALQFCSIEKFSKIASDGREGGREVFELKVRPNHIMAYNWGHMALHTHQHFN